MEVRKEKSKGKGVQDFASMIVAVSAFVAAGVFIGACVIANDMYYGEGAVIAVGLAAALVVVLAGKFMGDLLGCMGEMAQDMRWIKNIMEAKAMQDDGIIVIEGSSTSAKGSAEDGSPSFIDWILKGAGKDGYADAFRSMGATDYRAFMKLTKEDFSRMGMPSDDVDRFLRIQGRMRVSG